MPLHGLGVNPCVKSEEWASDTVSGQMPLSILVQLSWLVTAEDRVTVNKVAAVYEALLEENMVASGVALAPSTATKKVWVPLETYIPRCLVTALLMGTCALRIAWSILRNCAKKLRILEAFTPLWAWLRIRFLTDYMGNLDLRLSHFPAALQSAELIELRLEHFKAVQSLPSSVPFQPAPKLPPPMSPAEILRAALCRPMLHASASHGLAPHSPTPPPPPRDEAVAFLRAADPPGVATKTPAITFGRRWEVLLRYAHVAEPNRLAPIYLELAI